MSCMDDNLKLLNAFPSCLEPEARKAISRLPEDTHFDRHGWYEVNVAGERLNIPVRIYHDLSRISLWRTWGVRRKMLEALLSRHADGFVRQRYLARIIREKKDWIPPFVILLAGEYVVEILDVIWENRACLDRSAYGEFLRANVDLVQKTGQRILSYWDCYYKSIPKKEYVGFWLLEMFRSLVQIKA